MLFFTISQSYLLLSAAEELRQGLAVLAPLVILGRGSEFHVARGVQRGFDRVLNDADDEADADDLHGNIVRNAEQ